MQLLFAIVVDLAYLAAIVLPPLLITFALCRRLVRGPLGLARAISIATLTALLCTAVWPALLRFNFVAHGTDGTEGFLLFVICPLVAVLAIVGALLGSRRWALHDAHPWPAVGVFGVLALTSVPLAALSLVIGLGGFGFFGRG